MRKGNCRLLLWKVIEDVEDEWERKSNHRKVVTMLSDLYKIMPEITTISDKTIRDQTVNLFRKEFTRRADSAVLAPKVKTFLKNVINAHCRCYLPR